MWCDINAGTPQFVSAAPNHTSVAPPPQIIAPVQLIRPATVKMLKEHKAALKRWKSAHTDTAIATRKRNTFYAAQYPSDDVLFKEYARFVEAEEIDSPLPVFTRRTRPIVTSLVRAL